MIKILVDNEYEISCDFCKTKVKGSSIQNVILRNRWYAVNIIPNSVRSFHICDHCSRIRNFSELKDPQVSEHLC